MKGAVLYGPRDVRYVEREDPKIIHPTDAIISLSATCVCGSDLWPYRGRFLAELINLVWNEKIRPDKVFDLTLPLDQVVGGQLVCIINVTITVQLCWIAVNSLSRGWDWPQHRS